VTMLDPLGETAVEGLLDALGNEVDRTRRATLVSMLAGLASRYPAPVEARLDDDRWYVVRNAVNILHKAGGGAELVPLLQKVEEHVHAAVRREVIWGLVSVLGADAAGHMRRFVGDHDPTVRERAVGFLGGLVSSEAVEVLAEVAGSTGDPSLRRRALDELAHNRLPDAMQTLRRLASFRNRPRLPRSLRRHARKLLRQRRRST
jgi:HEAT repeat protein